MSYAPSHSHEHSLSPPAPPPKHSGPASPARGPPLPPPPPQTEPSELDGSYASQAPHTQGPLQPYIPPIEEGWLPEIVKDKTTSDLQALLSDTELQSALLSNPSTTHSSVLASEAALRPLLDQNINLANSLADFESKLSQLREATQSRLLALRALEQQHRTKLAETEQALEQFSPMALYQRLAAGAQEQDQLVRGMEESWLEEDGMADDREVADFVRRVKEGRRIAFLRGERKGRWDEGRVGGWR